MLLRCGRVFEEMPRSFVTMWNFAEFLEETVADEIFCQNKI